MITETQQGRSKRVELFELLESIDNATPESRVELVKKYTKMYTSFSDYVRCVFDKKITFLLPDSRPPFTPAEEQAVPSSWHRQNTNLTYFVKGLKADHINTIRRESMYIGMLESVHPQDAEILIDMIAKKTPCKGLTVEVVKEVFPNLL